MANSCKSTTAYWDEWSTNAKQPIAVSPPSPQAPNMAPAVQPKKRSWKARSQIIRISNDAPYSQNIELRFSFTSSRDRSPGRKENDSVISQSFSGLSMNASANRPTSSNQLLSKKASPVRSVRPTASMPQLSRFPQSQKPQHPELSKPRKKREGYGFSYSETFMYDSEDYPDTECGSDSEEQTTESRAVQSANHSAGFNPYVNWDGTQQVGRPPSRDSATTVEDRSFDDLLVLRDVGSFHLGRPQRVLPCTRATREDTARLKYLASELIDKHSRSEDIQAELLARLGRMVHDEQESSFTETETSVAHCALKLRDFLLKIKEDRIETGELRSTVEHEVEWVKWLVEASRTGVMHVRTGECTCDPDWDEE
jgi:hypothetical protein